MNEGTLGAGSVLAVVASEACGKAQQQLDRQDVFASPPDQVGFTVHPRRWVLERCFAWLNRNRRLAKSCEVTIASATSVLYVASAMLLVRRMARPREFGAGL
jgi:transposase